MKIIKLILTTHQSILFQIREHPVHQELLSGQFPLEPFVKIFLNQQLQEFLPRYSKANEIMGERFFIKDQDNLSLQFSHLNELIGYQEQRLQNYWQNDFFYEAFHKPRFKSNISGTYYTLNHFFENSLHLNQFSKTPGYTKDQLCPNPKTKITSILRYGQYLIDSSKTKTRYEAFASLLIPLWLHVELGKRYDLNLCSEDNPYLPWLSTFQDSCFLDGSDHLIASFKEVADAVKSKAGQLNLIQSAGCALNFELQILNELHRLGLEYHHTNQDGNQEDHENFNPLNLRGL